MGGGEVTANPLVNKDSGNVSLRAERQTTAAYHHLDGNEGTALSVLVLPAPRQICAG